jgi:ATP-dependent RNA helicase MSS116
MSDYEYTDSSTPRKGRIRPRRPAITQKKKQEQLKQQQQQEETRRYNQKAALDDPTLLVSTSFRDIPLHSSMLQALTDMGLDRLTDIQAQCWSPIVSGKSIIVRARTGTGKTLAYLLPSLQRLLEESKSKAELQMLILAPTRELVLQIAQQAEQVTRHTPELSVACIYGGTKKQRDYSLLQPQLPTILVSTLGRLLDHMAQPKSPLRTGFKSLQIMVLDEMDALLLQRNSDMHTILQRLPRGRQSLLVSATSLPSTRKPLLDKVFRGSDYEEIKVGVRHDDETTLTNASVEQYYAELDDMHDYLRGLVSLVSRRELQKVIIFLPTVRLVTFVVTYFESALGWKAIYKLHSQMSQSSRQRTREEFGNCQRGVLVTTNVSSRGVDYNNVDLVIQYGMPDSDDIYLHRLGRTARAGKSGQGLQVSLPFERGDALTNLVQRRGLTKKNLDLSLDDTIMATIEKACQRVRSGDLVLTPAAQSAYRSFLAYYVAHIHDGGYSLSDVVDAANSFSASVGLIKPPELSSKTAKRLDIAHLLSLDDDE